MDANAPGCFGSVLSYSSTDSACKACAYSEVCGEQSYKALLQMREKMDVSEFEKRFIIERTKANKHIENESIQKATRRVRRNGLTQEQEALVEDKSLPVKPRKLLASIFRKGYDTDFLKKAVRVGNNPFSGLKPVVLDKAFEMLIAGPFAKIDLSRTYMSMGMSRRTAYSQVSIIVAAFEILGIATSDTSEIVKKVEGQ